MQHELTETPNRASPTDAASIPLCSSQHGLPLSPSDISDGLLRSRARSSSPRSVLLDDGTSDLSGPGDQQSRSRHASRDSASQASSVVPGQHISDYEKARPTAGPATAGSGTVKRQETPSDAVNLLDFPNEILTHILSHLQPDSHLSLGLVSRRFYALVTNPHLWRTAFLRYFPAQDALPGPQGNSRGSGEHGDNDTIRSELRYFARLTSLASWRSEYLLRTRLLRSVARGKPSTSSGSIGSPSTPGQSGRKASAVLTYNSKLPWMVSSIHALFANGKKAPRIVSGTAELGVATASDPTTGKVDKRGLDDPFAFAQLDEMFPDLEPFGLGDGPAAAPNVVDVSQSYGIVGGEGFPGGRVRYKATNELRGRYLGQESATGNPASPDLPRIPELIEAVSAVWIAKNPAVPFATQSMVGIMTGSTLGIVTTYAIAPDSSGRRYANGDMTARWAVSPGVPIVAISVDDGYNARRKALGRVWAVALNALGEVFYLKDTPVLPATRPRGDALSGAAWAAGRTVSWQVIEDSRRSARFDDVDPDGILGTYSPRSSSDDANLSDEQRAAEAREISKFLRFEPAHFRKFCHGWDMRAKLEVDFAGGDREDSAGENIIVASCGHRNSQPFCIRRYNRNIVSTTDTTDTDAGGTASPTAQVQEASSSSLFGGPRSAPAPSGPAEGSRPRARQTDVWRLADFTVKNSSPLTEITAVGLDKSMYAVLAPFEDPLNATTPAAAQYLTTEIPGRRARLFAAGTNSGAIHVWNVRTSSSSAHSEVEPLRIIQTESAGISCVALSALYVVHGGSDGLVQVWDPLASDLEPVRTVSSRSSGRLPRHMANANPALRQGNFTAVGAIFLDPDPTVLRGVVSFGTLLRYWTYSSTSQPAGRKRRRLRHSDVHGRLTGRRQGGVVSSYIAAEEAELRREREHRAREQARLQSRFGVGLGGLTEEEALRYAEMISHEAFLLDEQQRRLSPSDTSVGSAADPGEATAFSSAGSVSAASTVTPEPSLSGTSPPPAGPSLPVSREEKNSGDDDYDDYEAQIQRAIRLSLMEGVNDVGESPRGIGSGEYEFAVRVKDGSAGSKKKGSSAPVSPPFVSSPFDNAGGSGSGGIVDADEGDLELALRLSLQEEEDRQAAAAAIAAAEEVHEEDDFPPLEVKGKGKGKAGDI